MHILQVDKYDGKTLQSTHSHKKILKRDMVTAVLINHDAAYSST